MTGSSLPVTERLVSNDRTSAVTVRRMIVTYRRRYKSFIHSFVFCSAVNDPIDHSNAAATFGVTGVSMTHSRTLQSILYEKPRIGTKFLMRCKKKGFRRHFKISALSSYLFLILLYFSCSVGVCPFLNKRIIMLSAQMPTMQEILRQIRNI